MKLTIFALALVAVFLLSGYLAESPAPPSSPSSNAESFHDPDVRGKMERQLEVVRAAPLVLGEEDVFRIDGEWDELPRSGATLWVTFVKTPAANWYRQLYRNSILNPTDKYLPPGKRRELVVAIDNIRRAIRECHKTAHTMKHDRLRMAVRSGRALSVRPTDMLKEPLASVWVRDDATVSQLYSWHLDRGASEEKAQSLVLSALGWRVIYPHQAALPPESYTDIEKARSEVTGYLSLELAGTVANWFHKEGALSDPLHALALLEAK